MADRYVVRELEGFRQITATNGFPGLSVVVLDSRWNYRRACEFKTEEADRRAIGRVPTREEARAWARAQAADLAARLHEATP
jgi:hypothetical protein